MKSYLGSGVCALMIVFAGAVAFGSEGVNDIINLQRGGVDRDVMLAFVSNSAVAYDLSAEEIQQLEDASVPPTVVVAMIQRGKVLRDEAPTPVPVPVTQQASPRPDYAAEPVSMPVATVDYAPPEEDLNVSYFYETLAPHGTWYSDPNYGNVWEPNEMSVNVDWRPYSQGGQWVWSDHGWYFQSSYTWGWAAFHYGRWYRTPEQHWRWVPGTNWAASWVDWRQSDENIGWAPLPPDTHYESGIGFSFHNRRVGADFHFGLGESDYAFVSSSRFLDVDLGRAVISREHTRRVYDSTRVVNNTYIYNDNRIINNGISPEVVSRATRRSVEKVQVVDMNVAAGHAIATEHRSNNTIVAYKPQVKNTTPFTPQAAIQRSAIRSRHENSDVAQPGRGSQPDLRGEGAAKARLQAETGADRKTVNKTIAAEHRATIQSEQDARDQLKEEKTMRAAKAKAAVQERKATVDASHEERVRANLEAAQQKKSADDAAKEVRRDTTAEKRDAKVQEARDTKAEATAKHDAKSQEASDRKAADDKSELDARNKLNEEKAARASSVKAAAQERKTTLDASHEERVRANQEAAQQHKTAADAATDTRREAAVEKRDAKAQEVKDNKTEAAAKHDEKVQEASDRKAAADGEKDSKKTLRDEKDHGR